MAQTKVLVVDDDSRLRALLERYLTTQGFSVRTVADGEQMTRLLATRTFDLIVLDLMLPGEDGFTICQRLRESRESIPIIMLTARGDENDRIAGLNYGADDYLAKPFNPAELTARIHAVLRRSVRQPATLPETGAAECFGPFRLDTARRCMYREQTPIPLTEGEFALLKILVRHAGTPLSRERLLGLLNGRDYLPDDRSIDVQISRLRRLVEENPSRPRYLQTVRGIGYVLVPDGDTE